MILVLSVVLVLRIVLFNASLKEKLDLISVKVALAVGIVTRSVPLGP